MVKGEGDGEGLGWAPWSLGSHLRSRAAARAIAELKLLSRSHLYLSANTG